MSDPESRICPECGCDEDEYQAPIVTHSFRFFRWEIQFWIWGDAHSCLKCEGDREQERMEYIQNAAYDAGMRDGYKECERLYQTGEP